MTTVLRLERVAKSFGGTRALNDVSFEVERGGILALLGPSGCGKTTTLRVIAGFEQPDSGGVEINGRSVVGLRPYERNVGLVFQDYALFPHMTVAQNLAYGMRHRGIAKGSIAERTDYFLGLVQMRGMDQRFPRQLSGGQAQRVALARALSTEPEVLLLDEPLSALDAKLRAELQVELKAILRKAACTAIIVTHDQEEAMSLGDEVIVMDNGLIVQRGTPDEIYDRPANRFVAEFVGRSNWFFGRVAAPHRQGMAILHTDDGLAIEIPTPSGDAQSREVCLRPERILLLDSNAAPAGAGNAFVGAVQDVVYLGSTVNIYMALANGRRLLISRANDGTRFERDEQRGFCFQPSDCHLLPIAQASGDGERRLMPAMGNASAG